MAKFLEVKARISLGGPILQAPLVSFRLVLLLLAAILISAPYLIRCILESGTLFHYQRLWMSVALFGVSLGAESFAIGFLYMVVGLVLAFVTHLLIRFRSISDQRGFMLAGMTLAYWAVSEVIYLDNWKTGYRMHSFRLKSWR
ncbi:putative dolichyl-diphosphooligosaccharide--protein glycosyltransferase subunit 3 [Curcuma longa]|uniref:putative dolichyl-diphosphooligosaccharide--protein glycosyltransferase subunit 3 n=1 Tax=Curcuma longa TaxID=136217 RepID=UPI003D9EFBE2